MVLIVFIVLSFFVPWPWNLAVVCIGLVAEVFEVMWGRRLAKRWRPRTGAEAMIGAKAHVVSPCRPSGQVRIHGELWAAVCRAGAGTGDVVRVTALDGLTLVVKPLGVKPLIVKPNVIKPMARWRR
jgi:membrane-bound serine protease (ClpP class)